MYSGAPEIPIRSALAAHLGYHAYVKMLADPAPQFFWCRRIFPGQVVTAAADPDQGNDVKCDYIDSENSAAWMR